MKLILFINCYFKKIQKSINNSSLIHKNDRQFINLKNKYIYIYIYIYIIFINQQTRYREYSDRIWVQSINT